jgi:hypothetical protein
MNAATSDPDTAVSSTATMTVSPNSADGGDPARVVRPIGQTSRAGTKAITVHFPEEVRRQLKTMAGEQGRDVADMVAEGLNLLFAKYQRAELAPRKSYK